MEKEDCKMGMKVILWDDLASIGEVYDFSKDDHLITIKLNDNLQRVHPQSLKLYDEEVVTALANSVQEKFNKATSALEAAFQLVAEAQEEVDEAGYHLGSFKEGLVDFKEFEAAIEDQGWSSSTFWCNIMAG